MSMNEEQNGGNIIPDIAPKPPRRRKLLKVLLIIIAIPFVLLLLVKAAFSILSFVFPDSPPPDDSYLMLQTLNIPKEDNAFYDLERASSTLPQSGNNEFSSEVAVLLSGKTWDSEKSSSLISPYATSMKYFNDASLRKFYQVPSFERPENISYPVVYPPTIPLRIILRAVALDARTLYEEGKIVESVDRSFELVRVGALMESSPQQSFLDYLIGMNAKRFGLERLSKIIADAHVEKGIKERIARDVILYRDDGKGLVSGFKFEYVLNKSIRNNGQRVDTYNLRPNITSGYFMNNTDYLINRVHVPCSEFASTSRKKFIDSGTPEWLAFIKVFVVPNGLGKIFFSVQDDAMDSLFKKRCDEEATINTLSKFPD